MTGDLLLLEHASVGPVVKPTRDQVCAVRHQFQGMSIALPPGSTFDPLKAQYWFDPLINDMSAEADRLAVYRAHRAVGDTHLNLSLGLNGLEGVPRLMAIALEAIEVGGIIVEADRIVEAGWGRAGCAKQQQREQARRYS